MIRNNENDNNNENERWILLLLFPVPRSIMMCLLRKKNIIVTGSYNSYILLKSGTSVISTYQNEINERKKENLTYEIYHSKVFDLFCNFKKSFINLHAVSVPARKC